LKAASAITAISGELAPKATTVSLSFAKTSPAFSLQ
jgi:hypothetical protein